MLFFLKLRYFIAVWNAWSLVVKATWTCTAVLLKRHFELVRLSFRAPVVTCLIARLWLRLLLWSGNVSLPLILCLKVRLLLWLPGWSLTDLRTFWFAWVAQRLVPLESFRWGSWCHLPLTLSLALLSLYFVILEDWLSGGAWAVSQRVVWCLLSLGHLMSRLFLSALILAQSLSKWLHIFSLLVSSVRSLCLFEAIVWCLLFLVCLNTLVANFVQFMTCRWLWSSV